MKSDKLLISSSMVAAMWDKKGYDNLKLLEPFVLVSVAELFEPGEQIDKRKVVSVLEGKYAFRSMPVAVVEKILSRVAAKGNKLIRQEPRADDDGKCFTLVSKPASIAQDFDTQRSLARQDTDAVLERLLAWFQERRPRDCMTLDKLTACLGAFFETNGLDVLYEPDELRGATASNTDAVNYQIGRFILDAQEHDPDLFEKITHIAKGIMIASAIYIDTKPESDFVAQRHLNDLKVYLDTTFLLFALNYKQASQKAAADALLDLLRNNGAQLYVFPQHLAEIGDILRTFKDRDGYSVKRQLPLERLEEERYTALEIDRLIRGLETSLGELDITVAPRPDHVDSDGGLKAPGSYIDYTGLEEHLKTKMTQYEKHPTMLHNDADAISAVMLERSGIRCDTVETCPAVFVTTNYTLIRETNYFLHFPSYAMQINPIISDVDLTTILWLKYGMHTADVPVLKLVEYARAAIAPSESVMERFYAITQRMARDGKLTEDEAAMMRFDAYAKAEVTAYCKGDASELDESGVLQIRDKVKAQYTAQAQRQLEAERRRASTAEAASAFAQEERQEARRQAGAAQTQLEGMRSELRGEIARLRDRAETDAKRFASGAASVARWALTILAVAAMAVTVGSVVGVFVQTLGQDKVFVIAGLVSVVSAAALWRPVFAGIGRLHGRLYRAAFDWKYARGMAEAEPQIKKYQDMLADDHAVSETK